MGILKLIMIILTVHLTAAHALKTDLTLSRFKNVCKVIRHISTMHLDYFVAVAVLFCVLLV